MLELFASILRLWTPLALVTLGGVVTERVGVVALHLEGAMIAGSFAAVSVSAVSGNGLFGVVAGVVAGSVVGVSHAVLTQFGRVPGVLSGVGLNLAMLGLSNFLLRRHGESGLATRALVPESLALLAVVAVLVLVAVTISASALGLRMRAVGEKPETLRAAGVSPESLRLWALGMGGALTGLGGAFLGLVRLGEFTENMTAGRGYLALAAVILGRWNPMAACGAALLFATGDALTGALQNAGFARSLPPDLLQLLPYLAALLALGLARGRSGAPQALSH